MKYFIGIPIPKAYKTKVELLRAKYKFFTTEPHITLIPPPALPADDSFIKNIIEICKKIKPFNIELENINQFDNRVLYVGVNSPKLINLHKIIYNNLSLEKENREYIPHLTIVKQRPGRPVPVGRVKKDAEINLPPHPSFLLNSLIVYSQPKEKSIFIPYMKVPFDLD